MALASQLVIARFGPREREIRFYLGELVFNFFGVALLPAGWVAEHWNLSRTVFQFRSQALELFGEPAIFRFRGLAGFLGGF